MVTTEWGTLRDSFCELLWAHREENFCRYAEGGEDSEGFSKKGRFESILKDESILRICKAGSKGMGREVRVGEILATWSNCEAFALESSRRSKAGLLPLQRRWYLSLCTEFPLSESGLWDCICLQGRSTENQHSCLRATRRSWDQRFRCQMQPSLSRAGVKQS